MRHLFAAVLAAACVVGATSSFARGGFRHGAGHGGFVRNPIIWGHRPRRCRPSKTGFRPRYRHPRRHPSSTVRCRNRHCGECKRQPSVGQPWPRSFSVGSGALDFIPAKAQTWARSKRRRKAFGLSFQNLVYGTRLSVPRIRSGRRPEKWNLRGRIRWSLQPNIGRWQRSSIAWPACAGHLSPRAAPASREGAPRARGRRGMLASSARAGARDRSERGQTTAQPASDGLSLKGVYALKVGYAETHSCPRPGARQRVSLRGRSQDDH